MQTGLVEGLELGRPPPDLRRYLPFFFFFLFFFLSFFKRSGRK